MKEDRNYGKERWHKKLIEKVVAVSEKKKPTPSGKKSKQIKEEEKVKIDNFITRENKDGNERKVMKLNMITIMSLQKKKSYMPKNLLIKIILRMIWIIWMLTITMEIRKGAVYKNKTSSNPAKHNHNKNEIVLQVMVNFLLKVNLVIKML